MSLTRQQLDEIDRENIECMIPLNRKDGPTPYYLDCPLDAIEKVARGLRDDDTIMFWPMNHIIQVGQQEWSLDGNLQLWREARFYADKLREQGLLVSTRDYWIVKYSRA